ncbi:MAG: DUF2993 domain-containing protein [Chloroflexi bacterium]|nr:DUF2993 domain-containing protein [Chloroflexota bacterium]
MKIGTNNKKALTILVCLIIFTVLFANLFASFALRMIMPWMLGPADSYSVWLWAWPWDAPFGKISRIVITGKNVRVPRNPRFQYLKINIRNMDLDAFSWNINKTESTKFKAVLNEDDINKYLAGKLGPIKDHRLKLLPGRIAFEGIYQAPLKIFIPISLEGKIIIDKRELVMLELYNLKIINTSIPRGILKVFNPLINPIADLKKSKIRLLIDNYEIREHTLNLEGEAYIRGK